MIIYFFICNIIIEERKGATKMKKRLLSILSLSIVAMLAAGCNSNKGASQNSSSQKSETQSSEVVSESSQEQSSETQSSSEELSSYGEENTSSEEVSSEEQSSESETTSSEEEQPELQGLDLYLSQFLNGTGLTLPSLTSYELNYHTLYYYEYGYYFVSAFVEDEEDVIAPALAAAMANTNWAVYNDDDYPIEDYGYMFADDATNPTKAELNFINDGSYFALTLYRLDGGFGIVDVSDVDTNWYVDYINFYNYSKLEELPVASINQYFQLSLDNIPFVNVNELVYYEGYDAENSRYYINVVIEGKKGASLANAFESAGYEVITEVQTTYDIDWDNYEIVEVQYNAYRVFDADHLIYISFDESSEDVTSINFNAFTDVYSDELDDGAQWDANATELMEAQLGEVLPLFPIGAGYEVVVGEDDDGYRYLAIIDTYYKDLSNDIIDVLLGYGFVYEDYGDYSYYVLDNHYVYMEVEFYYYDGNEVVIWLSESDYVPATSVIFSVSEVEIVAGASYQLEYTLYPEDAESTVSFESSNTDVATVDEDGLVTISSTAAVDATAIITITTSEGITDTCTFIVKGNTPEYLHIDQGSFEIGVGHEVQLTYTLYPVGSASEEVPVWSIVTTDPKVTVSQSGLLTVPEDAEIDNTVEVTVQVGAFAETIEVHIVAGEVVDVLNQEAFGLTPGDSSYAEHDATGLNGSYHAQCAATKGIQLRSKNSNSGIVGNCDGKVCRSITIEFDASTYVPSASRSVDIYASNSPFTIADMYNGGATKVGSIEFDADQLTQTYEFTADYQYIGIRSNNGAVYLNAIEVTWH